MAEERNLVANIIPVIDESTINDLSRSLQTALNNGTYSMEVSAEAEQPSSDEVPSGSTSLDGSSAGGKASIDISVDKAKEELDRQNQQNEEKKSQEQSANTKAQMDATNKATEDLKKSNKEISDEESNRRLKNFQRVESVFNAGNTAILGSVGFIKNIVDSLWTKVLNASPVLKEVMNLIDTSFNLIFIPMGTAFAQTIIPAVINIIQYAVELRELLWNTYEEGGLGEMIKLGLELAWDLYMNVIKELWAVLPDDGIIGSIKRFTISIANFLQDKGMTMIEKLLDIASMALDHIVGTFTLLGAFYGSYLGVQALGIFSEVPGLGTVAAAVGGGAMAGGLGGFLMGTYLTNGFDNYETTRDTDLFNYSRSNMMDAHRNVTISNTFNGLGVDEVEERVRGVMRDEISDSSIRSGFR